MKLVYAILISALAIIVIAAGTALVTRMFISPPIEPSYKVAESGAEGNGSRIRLEVLNATERPGLAATATEYLRRRGFDVLLVGNASRSGNVTSCVLNRLGEREPAQRVARALGVSDTQVITEIDTSLYLNATVIIGWDYKKLKPFK